VNCVEITFDFKFDVFLNAILSSCTCKQSLETYLGVGRSKLGILGEKGEEPESCCAKLLTVCLSVQAQF